MIDSDDTTTPNSENDEDHILFLNGSQRRGDFCEYKNPHEVIRKKPKGLNVLRIKDYLEK